jgi:p-cumate 2,3-dioxygenase beta subunit
VAGIDGAGCPLSGAAARRTRRRSPRHLFLIADDRRTLASRVRQLLSGTTWAENPRSRTRRLITNVRLLTAEGGEARATANFAVWRYLHRLFRGSSGLMFRERRAVLDLETLRPHGKLSFIL